MLKGTAGRSEEQPAVSLPRTDRVRGTSVVVQEMIHGPAMEHKATGSKIVAHVVMDSRWSVTQGDCVAGSTDAGALPSAPAKNFVSALIWTKQGVYFEKPHHMRWQKHVSLPPRDSTIQPVGDGWCFYPRSSDGQCRLPIPVGISLRNTEKPTPSPLSTIRTPAAYTMSDRIIW